MGTRRRGAGPWAYTPSAAWSLEQAVDAELTVHLVPVDDLRPHRVHHDQHCWCCPESNVDNNVEHIAMDQRDRYQHGGDLVPH